MARGTWLTFGVAAQDRAYFEFKVNKLAEGSFQVLRALSDPPRLETVVVRTASLPRCFSVALCTHALLGHVCCRLVSRADDAISMGNLGTIPP